MPTLIGAVVWANAGAMEALKTPRLNSSRLMVMKNPF
jgi:hypothetical protein